MVPEDQQEGAASSAPAPTDQSTLPDEPEAAESAEGPHGAEARYSWADLSEGATAPTAAESLAQPDTSDLGADPLAPKSEVSEFEDPPRFEALSLLDPVRLRSQRFLPKRFSKSLQPTPPVNSPSKRKHL